MAIWNLGSVNADLVYRLPHLPAPGETLAALSHQRGLGGKGANMSVAAVRAGGDVHHIGAVGEDGVWMRDRLEDYGVGVAHIRVVDAASGHAIIALDGSGENQIIIHPGANILVEMPVLEEVLSRASAGDIAVFQNETNVQRDFARAARDRGLRVCYAAAPFSVQAVRDVLDQIDILVVNAVEAAQLEAEMGLAVADIPVADVVITLGADGCRWLHQGRERHFDAPRVTPVDTTGAGDTFTGYLLAALDNKQDMARAISRAQMAGAVMVTRLGTADVIPTQDDIDQFFASF